MSTETMAAQGAAGIWATFRESPLAVKTVLGGVFVNKVGSFLNIFLVLFMTSQGYSAGQAATALGVYGAGSVIGVLIGGAMADRLGSRNATVLSMASSAVLIASLLYLPNYSLLLGAVAVVGAVGQIYRPASATLLSELTPDDRQVMIFAMYRFGLNLGTMAAPLIGFALYNLDGKDYDLLFWGEALVALGYAVLALLTLPARRRTSAGTGDAGEDAAEDAAQDAPQGSYLTVLRDRRYVLFLIATFFNAAVYIQYLSTLPLDVSAAGVPIFWYTLAVSLNGFVIIAFELPMTKLTQHWPFKVTLGVTFTMVGIGMATYGLPMGPAVILAGTLIWTLSEVIGGPTFFAYPAMAGPAHLRGRYIGAFQFVFGLGAAVGPVVGGVLFVQLGHAVWPVLAIGSLVAVVCGVAGIRNPKDRATAPAATTTTTESEPATA
jgi:MFS family permease